MYYALEFDKEFGIPAVLTEADPGSDLKYMQGLQLDSDERPIELKLETDQPRDGYPDLFNAVRAPVASDKFVRAIASVADNVEWYEAEIHAPNGIVASYRVMNVIGRISCMNMKSSTFTSFRNRVARIKSLALDEDKIGDVAIFRLEEYPTLILLSGRARKALAGLTGFVLVPAPGWSDKGRF